MILLSLAAAFACGCMGSDGGSAPQGALTYQEFKDFKHAENPLGSMGYGYSMQDSHVGYSAPKGVLKPIFLSVTIGRSGKSFVAVLGQSNANSTVDRLWVDWNGDKKFSDDEQAKVVADTGDTTITVFKPVSEPKIGGKAVPLAFVSRGGGSVTVIPGGYMGGTVDLDGKTVKVGVVDTNANGVYGDCFTAEFSGDLLLIDRNGNGVFDPGNYASTASLFEGEMLPLLSSMPLSGDGLVQVVVKDSTIAFAPDTSPTGTIEFDGAKAGTVVVNGPKGLMFAGPGENRCKLPVGSYKVLALEYKVVDAKGAEWSFGVGPTPNKDLVVAAEKPLVLKCGAPLSVTLKDTPMQGVHSFSLSISDRSGAPLSNLADAKGGRPEAPKLTITDAKGKLIQSLAFSYG
jgi:hypothetical protein